MSSQGTHRLIDRLKKTLFLQRGIGFTGGLLATAALILAVWSLLSLIANVLVLPVWLKVSVLAVSAISVIYVFGRLAVGGLRHGSVDSIAVRLEQKHPNLRGRLIAAIQFARRSVRRGYSAELVDVTEQQAVKTTESLRFSEVVTLKPLTRTGKAAVASALVALALFLLFPGIFNYSF